MSKYFKHIFGIRGGSYWKDEIIEFALMCLFFIKNKNWGIYCDGDSWKIDIIKKIKDKDKYVQLSKVWPYFLLQGLMLLLLTIEWSISTKVQHFSHFEKCIILQTPPILYHYSIVMFFRLGQNKDQICPLEYHKYASWLLEIVTGKKKVFLPSGIKHVYFKEPSLGFWSLYRYLNTFIQEGMMTFFIKKNNSIFYSVHDVEILES